LAAPWEERATGILAFSGVARQWRGFIKLDLWALAFVVAFASLVVIPAGNLLFARCGSNATAGINDFIDRARGSRFPCGNDNQRGKNNNKGEL